MDDRTGRVLILTRIALFGLVSAAVLATLSCTSSSGGGAAVSSDAATPDASTAASTPASSTTPGAPVATAPSSVPVVVPTGTLAPYPTATRGAAPNSDQAKVLNSLPGSSAANTCLSVGAHSTLRSGSMAAGNFVTARKSFREQYRKTEVPELTMYLIPAHAENLTKATVSVFAQSTGTTKSVTTTSVQSGDAAKYFVAQVPVASPGSYRLTMSSGPDRGCFAVSFTA